MGTDSSDVALLSDGTVFIRHIDLLSKNIQKKLLKIFKNSKNRTIVSSELNLKDEENKGKIIPELWNYFGENIIHIPPLRARGEDIIALIDHFSRFFFQ